MCSIAAITENTPIRLATKFGVSFARITPLPSVVVRNASSASSIASSDDGPAISSHRCMYRGGLKKWMPQKRLRTSAGSAAASALIDSPEVFDATIAFGARCGPIFAYRSCFQSMRSAIASITRSHSASRARSWP